MQSFQHSRARILFEVACAFGIAASCVEAWLQTYATAMLAVAAIAALYGLVHAFDMLRRSPTAAESVGVSVEAAEPTADHREAQSAPVAEAAKKRSRKSPKQAGRRDKREAAPENAVAVAEAQPDLAEATVEPQPEIAEAAYEPEVAEPEPELHVVETASDEPEYVPATPLFEPEPFVRQQRAAFGRKARY